ncbi:MAG: J domain-containing protein [Acidobacteria bacterium]|nr:J domain-containing protein [Acidobacteriota bacterium]
MKNRRNYYRILKVQPDAPVEIIRASYRTMMRELKIHPDLGGSASEASILNEAYETLSDPRRRAAYDEKIRAHRFQRADSSPPKPDPGSTEAACCPFCRKPLAIPKSAEVKICPVCGSPLPSFRQPDLDRERRRTIARMKKNDPIAYSCEWPETPKKGTMIDLSPKGMRFLCRENLGSGTVLKITAPLLKACAVVTNQKQVDEKGEKNYSIGISFISVIFEETKGAFLSVSA